ncbi:MAG: DMT family transporter, partial [Zestosphaera sp.]
MHLADLILMMIAWVSISSASVLVILSGTTALVCAFWRVFLSSVIILSSGLVWRPEVSLASPPIYLRSVVAGVLLGFHFLTWMESLFLIPVALSTTVVVTYPLINAFFEGIAHKTLRRVEILGLTLAFIGVVIATQPQLSSESGVLGVFLAFIGSLCAAGYFYLGRSSRKSGMPLTSYTIIAYTAASLTLLIYALVTKSTLLPASTNSWVYVFLLAIIPMLGGHTIINYLLKKMKSYVVTSVALGEPPGATLL